MGTSRVLSMALLASLLVTPALADTPLGDPIGPGTVLMRIRENGPGGPVEALVLRVDLGAPGVRAGVLYPGEVARVATLSAMARSAGAFAAVNGDFFNIGQTGAPVGPMIAGGELIKAPQPGRSLVAGVGEDGVGESRPSPCGVSPT